MLARELKITYLGEKDCPLVIVVDLAASKNLKPEVDVPIRIIEPSILQLFVCHPSTNTNCCSLSCACRACKIVAHVLFH